MCRKVILQVFYLCGLNLNCLRPPWQKLWLDGSFLDLKSCPLAQRWRIHFWQGGHSHSNELHWSQTLQNWTKDVKTHGGFNGQVQPALVNRRFCRSQNTHTASTIEKKITIFMKSRNSQKYLWLRSPTHVASHGQWWSNLSTHLRQSSQWRLRRGCCKEIGDNENIIVSI